MTRLHALITVAAGLATTTAGLVWLFGPFGFIGVGVPVVVGGLLLDDGKE